MKRDIKITSEEFNEYSMWNKVLSDIDFGYNPETGEYDVPALEWESDLGGRYWWYYKSEEAREAALDEYNKDMEDFVLNLRAEKVKSRILKERKSREIAKMKTLGGMFPELEKLKYTL